MNGLAAWEAKTISKVIAGVFMGLIIMIVMWWAIHTGIRLTKEHKRDSKYHLLTSSIGVVTIVFGLVYFIIGLGIIEELVVDLFDHLQQKERKGNLYLTRLKQ
uniref:Uncharacterized protein n=1 Tax=Manihot esculenta TaxID=3983 RepID=A0A2C9W0N6_MANES